MRRGSRMVLVDSKPGCRERRSSAVPIGAGVCNDLGVDALVCCLSVAHDCRSGATESRKLVADRSGWRWAPSSL